MFAPAIAVAAANAPPPNNKRANKANRMIAATIPAAITGARISIPATRAQLRPSCPGIQAQTIEEFVIFLVEFLGQ